MTRLVTFFAVFGLVVACSGSSTSSGPTIDQACSDSAHARCTRLQACSAVRLQTLYGDEATCEARVKLNCTSALGAPSTAASPSGTATCTSAVAGWSCNDFLINANPPAGCEQKMGSLATGAPCQAFAQCQTGFCAFSPSSACGTCAQAPTAGQPCTAASQCALGEACSSDKTCSVPAQQGGACGPSATCAPGLHCAMGTCQPIDSTTTSGQACGEMNGKYVACAVGFCSVAAGQKTGSCVANAADGAACNAMTGPFCDSPAFCINNTCQIAACH